ILLRLLAPFLPYITEEVWSWVFAGETGYDSIHRAPWPGNADFAGYDTGGKAEFFDTAVCAWSAINKAKSQAGVSIGRPIEKLVLAANAATAANLEAVMSDVMAAARANSHAVQENGTLEDSAFQIVEAKFVQAE